MNDFLGFPIIESSAIPEGYFIAIGHDRFGFPELKGIIKLEPKKKEEPTDENL